MSDLRYEIIEEMGKLVDTEDKWAKELNLISWNDRTAKYDIRDWSPKRVRMGKGITLTKEELKGLKDILNEMDL